MGVRERTASVGRDQLEFLFPCWGFCQSCGKTWSTDPGTTKCTSWHNTCQRRVRTQAGANAPIMWVDLFRGPIPSSPLSALILELIPEVGDIFKPRERPRRPGRVTEKDTGPLFYLWNKCLLSLLPIILNGLWTLKNRSQIPLSLSSVTRSLSSALWSPDKGTENGKVMGPVPTNCICTSFHVLLF